MKTMNRLIALILVALAVLGICVPASAASGSPVRGTLNQKMATRTGPGGDYEEPGTFFIGSWRGQTVKVYSKAYTSTWWVQAEFIVNGEKMRAYTGLKRIDGINLDNVPEEKVIGSCRTVAKSAAYYGPGSDYKAMKHSVPANTSCKVIMEENNYLLVEYSYISDDNTVTRSWIRRDNVTGFSGSSASSVSSGTSSSASSSFRGKVKTGRAWWTEEPEWSYCDLSWLSGSTMQVSFFFYRIACINGTIYLDNGNKGNHGTFTGYFDNAPYHPITGEVWFTGEGMAIDMNAFCIDQQTGAAYYGFPQCGTFVYRFR